MMRKESDAMGTIEVPASKYWGAQTTRSLEHFTIGNEHIPREMVRAMAVLKKGAALANCSTGNLDKEITHLICQVCNEIMEGKLDDHFPLYVWMTGSGTQFNMNMNEVISNRAIELVGGELGSKRPVHPNDHVNRSQSSNDTFPTAMNIAAAVCTHERLLPHLEEMAGALERKAVEWKEVVKIGRTHLEDAVPMTLGQEFSGYARLIRDNVRRIKWSLEDVYHLALGGTAVGTGLNAPAGFACKAVGEISTMTQLPFVEADNKFAVMGSHDALVMLSGTLKTTACSLYKIANDIRLLASGPRAGLAELHLPENEPGSSIMPGKVNPTQCEALAMVAAQVMGNDVATALGGASGYLEMNVYKPLMMHNVLQSTKILGDSCKHFTHYCLEGIEPNYKRLKAHVENSLMLVTALSPKIGYDAASHLAHTAFEKDISLAEANRILKVLPEDEFEKALDVRAMLNMEDQ